MGFEKFGIEIPPDTVNEMHDIVLLLIRIGKAVGKGHLSNTVYTRMKNYLEQKLLDYIQ